MSTSLCGKICITQPKCLRKARVHDFYSRSSIVDAAFHCESESTLFGVSKEDTTRNQRLSCLYNTLPEQFNPNIRVCAAHFTEDYFPNL